MRTSPRSVGLVVVGLLSAHLASALNCPNNYVAVAENCYRFAQEAKAAYEAESACNAEGGSLADVATDGEKDALMGHINAYYPGTFWTAGRNTRGEYEWANTQQQVPTKWRGRQFRSEGDMCVYICSRTNKLWESLCSTPKRYVCKNNVRLDVDSIDAF